MPMAKALDRALLWIKALATCLQKVTAPTEFFSAIACMIGFGVRRLKEKNLIGFRCTFTKGN
jgi:hypothetical protein